MAQKIGASFRDPNGFITEHQGEFLRVVQPSYAANYDLLLGSGLYDSLVKRGLLIPHEEIQRGTAFPDAYKLLKPQQLSFISYPYEWCFSQLKDAALATLEIQKLAIAHGMNLKDATAYNIQFVEGRPLLIDTLSFEKLEAKPWIAYGQFCRHFLAPLALMSYRDVRLSQLLRVHLDGIPLELASKLLPTRSRLKLWLLIHLHLHSASERKLGDKRLDRSAQQKYSIKSLEGLIQSLGTAIETLRWEPPKNVWGNYYEETVTPGKYVGHKKEIVSQFLQSAKPAVVWDLGANTGLFSRLAAENGSSVLSFDGDPDCVEINYLEARKKNEKRILPLLMDLVNPSPALGWDNSERMRWLERHTPDLTIALALIHHLAIGNNLPWQQLVEFFHKISPRLIIEFVPKNDPNAQKLLRVREDIFTDYTREKFEEAFSERFEIEAAAAVEDSERKVYLMRRL
ncbi:MAG: SAM-dependent methyltransferase [Verrucomicrobia bacterium]|nr:SAM-dependent methyltransferase [Verrucomicrobiota bacterium]